MVFKGEVAIRAIGREQHISHSVFSVRQSVDSAPAWSPTPGLLVGDDRMTAGSCRESQELTKILLCLARASARACLLAHLLGGKDMI